MIYQVILILGISGGCRCDELFRMKVNDVEEMNSMLLVKVTDNKTKKCRTFAVLGDVYIQKYKKYISLRPTGLKDDRLFFKYCNGRSYRMVMGIHKIGSAAKEAAAYLKLPDSNKYTGHSFRKTSATLLVNIGADLTTFKQHSRRNSSFVAEG